ncbi:hypothetical protein CLOM_g5762 [Closterium sp. NIES-68]|nr:hypothetical protein CLOM_g5762 [Closterium sp. NIES-68]GJP73812.1 hypothetical protein CLOP_g4492 [Closterium sp. NIES-67]
MLFNHYLQGFQYPGFQGGSWASSSTLPALSPLPPRHEGADSAPAEPAAKAEMPRVDSSTHINSLVAQYSLAQAGAAAAAAACAGHPLSPAQLVSPRAGWPHFAAYPPVMGPMGPMGPIACVPGSDAILSPKPAAGRSASTDGSPSPSTGLPSLLESPLQSEVTLPAESDGESFCKVEFLAERVDGEVKVEPPEGAESAEQDWRVTKGTRRAMQLWLEGGAEGDVKGMGPFDWLDEPSGAEEATGLPHWVLAELGEGGAGKKSGEAVEEEVYRVLFRADSMESATGEEVRSETRENEKLMNDASPKSPLQSHDSCRQQFGDESPAMGMNTTAAEAPVEGGHVLNRVSQTGCAFSTSVKIGPSSGTGPNDEPIAQAPEDNTNEDIWRDVSALSDLLAASSSPILDSELCLELQAGGDWQF